MTAFPSRGTGNPPGGIRLAALLTFLIGTVTTSSVLADSGSFERQRRKALELERRGAWLEACRTWEDLLRRDRQNATAREGHARSLRRLHLAVRHTDPLYRQALLKLSPPFALDAYEQVLTIVTVAYPDRSRTSLTQLFSHGLHEVRLALDEPAFRKHYLPGVRSTALAAFKARLATWPIPRIGSRAEARDQVLAVVRAAPRDGIPLRPALVSALSLEFAAGACNALDEHSSFLSPGHLALVQAAIKGKLVGVGLDLGILDDRLQITRTHPRGPAEEAGLRVGDRLLRIAGVAVEALPAEAAAEKLRGDPGSIVEVEVARDGEPGRRVVKLIRRALYTPSVEYERILLDDGTGLGIPVGWLRIHHFQDSTLQEVKEAYLSLSSEPGGEPLKGLLLDLRGNPGGLFRSAVAVAELFVSGGVIVIGHSPFKEYNRAFRADTPGALQLPIVVLIDGETASAAEVLAGALKDGRPGTLLVGQTSYGKGSIQCIIPVEKPPLDGGAGIRLTVARLFSPSSQPYTGRGVVPHHPTPLRGEELLLEARRLLLGLIHPGMPRTVVVGTM